MNAPDEVPVEDFKDDLVPFPKYVAWIVFGYGILVVVTCIVAVWQ